MPITLKKDVWKVKDPSSGQYRGAAILSTTLPQDAAQIISESNDTIQNIKDTAIDAVDTALNDESTGLIPKAEADRDAIDDSLNNATNGIIPTAQSDRDDIDDSLNNTSSGIIPEAQANLATIAQAVQSQIGQGTDKTLSVAKGFADAKAAGMLVKVSNYQPGSALDDPATSQDASQNTGYPVYKDSNRVWVKETYAELEVPTMDDVDELKSALNHSLDIFDNGESVVDRYVSYIDGIIKTISNQNSYASGYIKVISGSKLLLTGYNNNYHDERGLAFYTCNNTFISGYQYNNNIDIVLTVPENAEYIRLTYWKYPPHLYAGDIESQIGDIESQIGDIESQIGDIDYTFTNGKFVKFGNGSEGSIAAYAVTNYIKINAFLDVAIRTYAMNDFSGTCFYDANKNYISGYNAYSEFGIMTKMTIPTRTEYIRISCLVNRISDFKIIYSDIIEKFSEEFDQYTTKEEAILNSTDVDFSVENKKYINKINGSVNSIENTSFNATDFIDISNYESIIFYTSLVDNGGAAFYDANKMFLSGISAADGFNGRPTEYSLDVPANAAFFRMTIYSLDTELATFKGKISAQSIVNTFEQLREEIVDQEDNRFWSYTLWKVLCIGDSLTSGASYAEEWGELAPAGSSIDQNYPRLLGRMIDADVVNAGVSGFSASDWWAYQNGDRTGRIGFPYNFANYDTFIIWLGTNNGLTDTLDTDVIPYENYEDFAETETGYYCKIISAIKAANESCLIVLTKIFASKGNVATTNLVIDKIAQLYNLPVIDNSDLSVANHIELHAGVNNPHFGIAGNVYIANRYITRLGKWFNANPLRCEYGYRARTN